MIRLKENLQATAHFLMDKVVFMTVKLFVLLDKILSKIKLSYDKVKPRLNFDTVFSSIWLAD
jgi:hypothetical protein